MMRAAAAVVSRNTDEVMVSVRFAIHVFSAQGCNKAADPRVSETADDARR